MERQEIGLEHLKGTKVQYIWSCGLDTNALRAATASADFSSKVWDASTGVELHWFEHKHIVRACAFSENSPKQEEKNTFSKLLRDESSDCVQAELLSAM
ncbi:hypothetical protein QN277_005561 [Acacia crassicarpa]|uniref:Uncharacterized protein n=1 Tax=Acacia crassicarpa TaxID=499986 RepID=A0AAE1IWL4_9FABA|nr:hypothetical protein QN277_005561 [Acacia crassicarpa]